MEQNGVEYWFRTEDEMLRDLQAGKFVEAEVIHNQQVSGISIREIKKATDRGQIAITDADRGGVAAVIKVKPDTICLFFVPPSYEVWQQRIKARGDMEPGEYSRRMETALKEYTNALAQPYYTFVINDDLPTAIAKVDAIAHGHHNEAEQRQARTVAQDILKHLQAKQSR
jgi:guanylate kinase